MSYTIEQRAIIVEEICERLSRGESLRQITRDAGMPSREYFESWCDKNPEWASKRARARELQADALFDETLEIADAATSEDAAAVRIRADYRRWYMARCAPKKYGDRIAQDVQHSGEVTTRTISLSEREIIERYQTQKQQEVPDGRKITAISDATRVEGGGG